MAKSSQPYRFLQADSILGTLPDEYSLSTDEYYQLHSFFVTYSICRSCSAKKRSFPDYGWPSNCTTDPALSAALKGVLNLSRNLHFVFTTKDDLSACFAAQDLSDGAVGDLSFERAVIGITNESTNYHKLFRHIRNGFCHGKYKLRLSPDNEKMIVIQDDDKTNVTARIVLKLDTLLGFVRAIDVNGTIKDANSMCKGAAS